MFGIYTLLTADPYTLTFLLFFNFLFFSPADSSLQARSLLRSRHGRYDGTFLPKSRAALWAPLRSSAAPLPSGLVQVSNVRF
jgi:hypothetical protein